MIENIRELQPGVRRAGLLGGRRTWRPLPLATNWSAYSATERKPEYSVKDGSLKLRGTIKKTAAVTADERVGTLPASARPLWGATGVGTCGTGRAPIGILVKPDGEVWVVGGATPYGATLDPGNRLTLDGVEVWID